MKSKPMNTRRGRALRMYVSTKAREKFAEREYSTTEFATEFNKQLQTIPGYWYEVGKLTHYSDRVVSHLQWLARLGEITGYKERGRWVWKNRWVG